MFLGQFLDLPYFAVRISLLLVGANVAVDVSQLNDMEPKNMHFLRLHRLYYVPLIVEYDQQSAYN